MPPLRSGTDIAFINGMTSMGLNPAAASADLPPEHPGERARRGYLPPPTASRSATAARRAAALSRPLSGFPKLTSPG